MFRPIVVLTAFLATIAAGAAAHADEPRRYAILIGFNHGDANEVTLRYAASDARRVEHVLRTVGGFHAEDIVMLSEGGAADVRRALVELNARLRQETRQALLFVFYSGHADAEALHLGGSRLPAAELRALVAGSAASARVLVIDACRSGAVTRVKGGRVAPSFEVRLDAPLGAEGLAILSSSAAGEDAQESDQLGASFFTHYLASALIGAADGNDDGQITLNEAFAYASERTLAATAGTVAGPQHPTYRIDLGGRDDLVLTRPAQGTREVGRLRFSAPGWYVIARGPIVVADLHTDAPDRRLVLDAGRYRVMRRGEDHFLEGDYVVTAGSEGEVRAAAMRRVDYARVVRKGGSERRHAFSLFALFGARGDLLDVGTPWRLEAGVRLDLPMLSLDLRAGTGRTDVVGSSPYHLWELGASLGVLRAIDLGRFTLALGPTVGGSWFRQQLDPTHRLDGGAFVFGALGQVQLAVSRRFYLSADVSLLEYVVEHADETARGHIEVLTTYRAVAGVGVYL